MTLLIVEAANLFCGSHDPVNSKHLALQELKLLTTLEADYQDHRPGGSRVDIEIEVGIKKFTPTFKLVGFDPALVAQFGLNSPNKQIYTAYAEIKDRRTGTSAEYRAVMEGRLGKIEADVFKRGDLAATEYAINEMSHYEVFYNNQELVFWDFWTNAWRVNGVDQNASTNSILRVPLTGA
jgi:P2 family phage contractile tail tube protein